MNVLTVILIAISLSMDAFSLSLAYGTQKIIKKDILILSLIVGIYHFFMPLIGKEAGALVLNFIKIKPNIIVFVVLLYIGINMIVESFKNKEQDKILNLIELIFFGFAVSIDSFSVGIGFSSITNNYILSSFVFSVFSFIFTFMGLILGKRVNNIIGKLSTIIGGIILVIVGIIYVIK